MLIVVVPTAAESFTNFGPSPVEALTSLSYLRPSTVLQRRVSNLCLLPAFVEQN